jgi:hypothetical protein
MVVFCVKCSFLILTQKPQKILKEVRGNFANKKPTLLGIGLVYGYGLQIRL